MGNQAPGFNAHLALRMRQDVFGKKKKKKDVLHIALQTNVDQDGHTTGLGGSYAPLPTPFLPKFEIDKPQEPDTSSF